MLYLGVEFQKSHEIGRLIAAGEVKDPDLSTIKEEADSLTDYAVEVRYPDALFEPDIDDVTEAYKIAKLVRDYVKNQMVRNNGD